MEHPIDPQDGFGLLRSYIAHCQHLRDALGLFAFALTRRGTLHDLSKLKDDEFAGFSRINAAARINKFGSPEYIEGMKRERPTIDLHFSRNSHHPERPTLLGERAETDRGLPDDFTYWSARDGARMSVLDVIEMVCDWWAARKGYGDTRSWREGVELNLKSKGKYLSDFQIQLVREIAAELAQLAGEPELVVAAPGAETP